MSKLLNMKNNVSFKHVKTWLTDKVLNEMERKMDSDDDDDS